MIYILTSILSGLFTLITLILVIIHSRKKKVRNQWLAAFILSLFIFCSASAISAIKTAIIVKDIVIEGTKEGIAELWRDDRAFLLDSTNINTQIKRLKEYAPNNFKGKEPKSFYTYFGFRDWYRFPLVYPYSLNCIDEINKGYLCDEREVTNLQTDGKKTNQLNIGDISEIAFDKNMLLAKRGFENQPKSYLIFFFDNQRIENFKTMQEVMNRAHELDYSGPEQFITLKEYALLF
ncbi:hypothetical protein DMA11_13110 [Marinilabiliaceae bacterium JC017]|nr:hypothetical protein DMA11_13110 [Marinilabiliaceae bacterium JC017]